jgi:hypothetical protein
MGITANEFLARTMVLESPSGDQRSLLCCPCFDLISGCDRVHRVFKHNVKVLLEKRAVIGVEEGEVSEGTFLLDACPFSEEQNPASNVSEPIYYLK